MKQLHPGRDKEEPRRITMLDLFDDDVPEMVKSDCSFDDFENTIWGMKNGSGLGPDRRTVRDWKSLMIARRTQDKLKSSLIEVLIHQANRNLPFWDAEILSLARLVEIRKSNNNDENLRPILISTVGYRVTLATVINRHNENQLSTFGKIQLGIVTRDSCVQ